MKTRRATKPKVLGSAGISKFKDDENSSGLIKPLKIVLVDVLYSKERSNNSIVKMPESCKTMSLKDNSELLPNEVAGLQVNDVINENNLLENTLLINNLKLKLQEIQKSDEKDLCQLQTSTMKDNQIHELRRSSRINKIPHQFHECFEKKDCSTNPLNICQESDKANIMTRGIHQQSDRKLRHSISSSDLTGSNEISVGTSSTKLKTSIASKDLKINSKHRGEAEYTCKHNNSAELVSKISKKELIVQIDRLDIEKLIKKGRNGNLISKEGRNILVIHSKDKVQPNKNKVINHAKSLLGKNQALSSIETFAARTRKKSKLQNQTAVSNKNKTEVHVNQKTLRKKQPKHYADLTLEEETKSEEPKPLKKTGIPIYRVHLPDEQQRDKQDLYEFNDFSPKINKQLKRTRKSSIIFDKNTYEILKELEAKEIKAKKKTVRRKKIVPRKQYLDIVNCIIRNVMEKVRSKKANGSCEVTVKKSKNDNTKVVEISDLENEIYVTANGFITESNITTGKYTDPKDNITDTDDHSNDCDMSPIAESDEEIDGVDNCFGFAEESPITSRINIISNILIKTASTPVNFQGITRRPNANSTMCSPWRINCIATRPIFVSVKNNALPRIDQDMVLNHTVVKDIEESHSKTVSSTLKSSTKKSVQQSILDFVDSNIEKREPLDRSLFDYEEFQSPVKTKQMDKENAMVNKVKRSLVGSNMVSSTPIQRKILGDISNSSGDLSNESKPSHTLFGFDNSNPEVHQDENNPVSKPSRFDPKFLKSYIVKRKKVKARVELPPIEKPIEIEPDQSISISEDSDSHNCYKLFDDPENSWEKIEPIDLIEAKKRRRRLNSAGSDVCDMDHKYKKMKKKKIKVDVEQEKWIEEFNKQCDEVDGYDLIMD